MGHNKRVKEVLEMIVRRVCGVVVVGESSSSCQTAIGGSVSPADIVSMLLTSKDSDYEESEGLQTMGGEENNIKVSRTFELG